MSTIGFFKEISKIPRGSGNEQKIADYICNFAKERNLEFIHDKYNNVIIKKYVNNEEPIILQAHLDMVLEKENDYEFDFLNDGIDLIFTNEYITANNTTLGADNGIGVAQILNILDSDIDKNIEAIFTTNEETSMIGAEKIDLSSLKGKTMINLDGFNSDTILLGSAGFTDIDIITNYSFEEEKSNFYKLSLTGLEGGHSGFDIDKNRGNSIKLLIEFLLLISDIKIASFNGGSKINVIPTDSEVVFSTNINIDDLLDKYLKEKKKIYKNLDITKEIINDEKKCLSNSKSLEFISSINNLKSGVINKNKREEVTTSSNLALIDLSNNLIQIGLRSSIDSEEEKEINYLKDYSNEYGYKFIIRGHQPGFTTDENSTLVKKMKEAYYRVNNKYPRLESLHIAVEVGLIKEKIKDLNVVIISPNISGAHSTKEKVEISSIESCDRWLFEYLTNKEI